MGKKATEVEAQEVVQATLSEAVMFVLMNCGDEAAEYLMRKADQVLPNGREDLGHVLTIQEEEALGLFRDGRPCAVCY